MPTLVKPFINRTATKGGHRYAGGGDAEGTVYCRWYWLEVSAGSGGVHQGRQAHQENHKGGALVVPDPGGWEEGLQHTSGTVTLKSSSKKGDFSGSGVVTEDTAEVEIL